MFKKSLVPTVRLAVLALVCFHVSSLFSAEGRKKNIILILADDLGWSDVGYQGADLIETPHIDALAKNGASFSRAYAMPVCTPSRAALLTGKHAARLHMTIWSEGALKGPTSRKLLQAESLHDLSHSETTLAKHLQQQGYLTASIGKWHLGDAGHFPETHGFDVNIGGNHWGAPQTFFWPYSGSGYYGKEFRYVPGLAFGSDGEYLTDRLTDEALKVIDEAGDQPFFLYLAHYAPHVPVEAKAEYIAYFEKKLKTGMHHQNATYAAMVKSLDDSVGRVVEHLKKKGLTDNTIIIFASDNGGYLGIDQKSKQTTATTNNYPLRSGKGSCYEGGIRVPLIVNWPGVTSSESVIAEPVMITDIFHTLARAGKFDLAVEFPNDGVDLKPLLLGSKTKLKREALYFHFPHYYSTTTPASAVLAGRWKLLRYYEDDRLELFDLEQDPSEEKNVAAAHPQVTENLLGKLKSWLKKSGANFPMKNIGRRRR
ncbi:MAG: sulfatase [Verrucomicrobia bacterium]|nr:sulfatase [Verrucomicrobiota bacterium]